MARVDRIMLELDRDRAPIAGWVCGEGGAPRPFSGWTGLFSVLEQMVADASDGPGTPALAPPRAGPGDDRPPRPPR